MRLNWFSPLPPERTDIAHYTARIAPALMRVFDVTFWTDLEVDKKVLPPGAEVKAFDTRRMAGREFFGPLFQGVNVYNLGNDARFHKGIIKVARKIPGLSILHDTRLHHLVFESAREDESPFSSYIALAGELYGPEGITKARAIAAVDGRTIGDHVAAMPFIEPFLDDAVGVVCHSKLSTQDLQSRSRTPVLTLPLPFASLSRPARAERRWEGAWRFVMFGYVNPNRRLESILQALATWPDAPDFQFDVFGTLWDRPQIETLISRIGLSKRVTLHGFVSEEKLDAAIASAHLAFNLRHPTMGEASGGILRSWSQATPALVTKTGWYEDLSDEVAPKISIEREIPDIHKALDELVKRPDVYRTMGMAARERLETLHAPKAYAEALALALDDWPLMMKRIAGRRMMLDVVLSGKSREERRVLLETASQHVPELLGVK